MKAIRLAVALGLLLVAPALAQQAKESAGKEVPAAAPVEEKPAPYDERLERLSEILGAMHYLRNLCAEKAEDNWRASAQRIIDLEAGAEPRRKEKLTAAFNRGYRSFAAVHASCTSAALEAEERYRAEGATLAAEITARFGN